MSTENNTNEPNITTRRGPDTHFVIGLGLALICASLLIFSYLQNGMAEKNHRKKMEAALQELKEDITDLKRESIVNELKSLTKSVDALRETLSAKQPEKKEEPPQTPQAPAEASAEAPSEAPAPAAPN